MSAKLLRANEGFTLLEVLVALALMALMALIGVYLSGAIGSGRRAWEIREHIAEDAAIGTAREFLRRQIEQIWPAFEPTQSGEHRLVFSGAPDRLEFVSPISDGTNWGGLYRFVIAPDQARSSPTIRVAGDLFRPDTRSTGAAFDVPIIGLGGSMSFSYFGPPSADAQPVWQDHWNSKSGLPWLIRLSVTFPEGSSMIWQDLIVHLKLAKP